jgi:hypothetical protein
VTQVVVIFTFSDYHKDFCLLKITHSFVGQIEALTLVVLFDLQLNTIIFNYFGIEIQILIFF